MSVNELLQLLVNGGAVTGIAWAVAWLLDDFSWWHKFSPLAKKLLILAFSVALGVGATAVLGAQTWNEYAQSVIYIVTAWLATQVAHEKDPGRVF